MPRSLPQPPANQHLGHTDSEFDHETFRRAVDSLVQPLHFSIALCCRDGFKSLPGHRGIFFRKWSADSGEIMDRRTIHDRLRELATEFIDGKDGRKLDTESRRNRD